MERIIRTVTGDIPPEQLGFCHSHEHIFLERGRSFEVSPVLLMEDYDKSAAELVAFYTAGGRALVDAQPVHCGRMAEWLERASAQTDVRIVASTGFHKTVFYEPDSYLFCEDADEIAALYISEIESGMLASCRGGGGRLACRAGQIKTAVDSGGLHADATYEKLFEAAATAAKATGAPVMAHIEQGADALEIVEFFGERGVPADRLILCHLDRARYDPAYHRECASTGAYLEYDTIHRLKYHDDEQEAVLIREMLEAGYGGQLLLGLDVTNARMRHYGAQDMGLDFILREFIPFMGEHGVPRETMETMLIANPRKALTIRAGR